MQTSPILNQANPLSTPAPAKQADGNGAITPFNQMLSRELADRRNAEAPKAPDAGNAAPAAPSTPPAKAEDKKTAGNDKTEDSKDAASSSAADATAQTPTDMLALVAQAQAVAAPASDTTTVADDSRALAASTTKAIRTIGVPTDARGDKAGLKPDTALADASGKTPKADPDAIAGKSADTAGNPLAELAAKEQGTKSDFAAQIKDSLANTSAAMQPVQQAALHAAPSSALPAQDKLTPAVGTPAWDQALGQKVVWMVGGEQQSASLTLNPPDLGPLQVVLNVSNATATATFSAAQPEVRQALEAALPKLREMLGDAGIQLGQATVNSGAQNQQGPSDQHASHGGRRIEQIDNRADAALPRASRVQPIVSGQGLVDTFA